MTTQWVAKRKLLYGSVTIGIIAIAVGLPLYFLLHKTPTCDDGVKNQNEKGIDCGGVCNLLCPSDIVNPIVLWQRAFMLTPGVYNVVAYVQNPNVVSRVDKTGYVFRLYDSDNALIAERKGTTFIPANQSFAVFEAGIRTGARVPARTSFIFTNNLSWQQNDSSYKTPSLLVENVTLSNEATAPRIDATIHNTSLQNVGYVEVTAVVYDSADNAIAASRTVIKNLVSGGSAPATFTWPSVFGGLAVRKEILLKVYPAGLTF